MTDSGTPDRFAAALRKDPGVGNAGGPREVGEDV
jgi:hypothetical protein